MGFGTSEYTDSEQCVASVEMVLEIGYCHIDTARCTSTSVSLRFSGALPEDGRVLSIELLDGECEPIVVEYLPQRIRPHR